jgi:predicted CopG family antitoxin
MADEESINEVTQTNNNVESGDIAGRDVIKTTINIGRVSYGGKSQLEMLYEKLEQEKQNSTVFSEMVEELMHYKSYAENSEMIGLEKKLENGNRLRYLNFAESVKEKFTKKLLKNEHSETAQQIYAFLLAKVYSRFETHIYPSLNAGHTEEYINQLVVEFIIKPLEELLGNNLLHIYEDEINGMIYFLMGNCHIKWN